MKRNKMNRTITLLLLCCTFAMQAQPGDRKTYILENYDKMERYIPMRDGARLFTAIYVPKDQTRKYPILITRTPYSLKPYGENEFPGSLVPSMLFVKEGYIFVYQDVRGRWMSEGNFVDIRPHNPDKKNRNDIDESSDTYDTVEWLLKNLPLNNGKVGIYGISYPGFYASASLPGAHPAVHHPFRLARRDGHRRTRLRDHAAARQPGSAAVCRRLLRADHR